MPYMTADEVAAELRMSGDWVRRQCKAGVIPATKLGREWRISPADLTAFMRKYRGVATPAPQPRGSTIVRRRWRTT